MPISDKQIPYANEVKKQIENALPSLRLKLDDRGESIGKKIREASVDKVPYMIVVGDKEVAANKVAVRGRNELDLGAVSLEILIERLRDEIDNKK
jgi:threonyl-tRNA synthetase